MIVIFLSVLVLLSLPGGSAGEEAALKGNLAMQEKIDSTIASFESNVDLDSFMETSHSFMDTLNATLISFQANDDVTELKKDGEDSKSICMPAAEVSAMYDAAENFQSSVAEEVSSFRNTFSKELSAWSDLVESTQSVLGMDNGDTSSGSVLDMLRNVMGRMEVEGDGGYAVMESLVEYVESTDLGTSYSSYVNGIYGGIVDVGAVTISLSPEEAVTALDAILSVLGSQAAGIVEKIEGMAQ